MKISELRDKSVGELGAQEIDLKRELFNLRFQVVTGEIQNPRRIRVVKRTIARLKTVIAQKSTEVVKEEKGIKADA